MTEKVHSYVQFVRISTYIYIYHSTALIISVIKLRVSDVGKVGAKRGKVYVR